MRLRNFILGVAALALLVPMVASAQIQVTVEDLECIADDDHHVVTAEVRTPPSESTVRLYFRRLHQEVEDLYYVEMNASGAGQYWAVLPKPTDDDLVDKELEDPETEEEEEYPEAAWWQAKERSDHRDPNDDLNEDIIEERATEGQKSTRDWLMQAPLDEELEEWFEDQKLEPAEYFVAVVDASGRELARSEMVSVPVEGRCDAPDLNEQEEGQANNLVIGETAEWQRDRRVFHWECDGIVSRIDWQDILYVDRHCRACAFVWQKLAVPAGVAVLALILEDDAKNPTPEPASPTDPDALGAGPGN